MLQRPALPHAEIEGRAGEPRAALRSPLQIGFGRLNERLFGRGRRQALSAMAARESAAMAAILAAISDLWHISTHAHGAVPLAHSSGVATLCCGRFCGHCLRERTLVAVAVRDAPVLAGGLLLAAGLGKLVSTARSGSTCQGRAGGRGRGGRGRAATATSGYPRLWGDTPEGALLSLRAV